MILIGYLAALFALYVFYVGEVIAGSILFIVGGWLAKKLFFCLRSIGVVTMVVSIAYGFHHGYTPLVLFGVFIGFVFACFNTRRTSKDCGSGWGFDFDLSSLGSDSDCGGDGGGGD